MKTGGVELFAKSRHVAIDVPGVSLVSGVPHLPQELGPRVDRIDSRGELDEEGVLGRRELHLDTVDQDAHRRAFDSQRAQLEDVDRYHSSEVGPHTPSESPNARDHFARPARLHDVVVRTDLEPEDDVYLGTPSGDHENTRRRVVAASEVLADVEPRDSWQGYVEHGDIGGVFSAPHDRVRSVGRSPNREALRAQVPDENFSESGVVFDDEDVERSAHSKQSSVVSSERPLRDEVTTKSRHFARATLAPDARRHVGRPGGQNEYPAHNESTGVNTYVV